MKENFEYLIQQKAAAFKLEPAAEIWESVDAAINKKKKRRLIVFWWILPLVACLIMPFFLMDTIGLKKGGNEKKAASLAIEPKVTTTDTITQTAQQHNNNTYTGKQPLNNNNITNTSTTAAATEQPLKKQFAEEQNITGKTTLSIQAPSAQSSAAPIVETTHTESKQDILQKPILKQLDPVEQQDVISIAKVVAEPKQEEHTAKADTVAEKKDSIIAVAKKDTAKKADTTKNVAKDHKTKKKLQPFLLIAGGGANYTSTTSTEGMALANTSSPGWDQTGITAMNNNPFEAKGYYLSLGAGFAYELNKKVSLITQLQYSFVERTLHIGAIKDSAVTYYYPGSGKTVHNNLHQILVQQGLQLHNDNSKLLKLLRPEIGYQFKTTISSNWLAAEYWNAAYSNNYSTVNTVGLSLYAAIWFPVFKGWESGIQFSQDIMPISKYQQTGITGNYFGLTIKKSLTNIFNTSK